MLGKGTVSSPECFLSSFFIVSVNISNYIVIAIIAALFRHLFCKHSSLGKRFHGIGTALRAKGIVVNIHNVFARKLYAREIHSHDLTGNGMPIVSIVIIDFIFLNLTK